MRLCDTIARRMRMMDRCWWMIVWFRRMIFWLWWMIFWFGRWVILRLWWVIFRFWRWVIFWLWWMVYRFRFVVGCMNSKYFLQCCTVSRFSVARCWVIVDFHRLVRRFGRFNIVINGVVRMVVSVVHHMRHMWVFLHVIFWHPNAKNSLQAERMTSHLRHGGNIVSRRVGVIWHIGTCRSMVCWLRLMVIRCRWMVIWLRWMIIWFWWMVFWFRWVIIWLRCMVSWLRGVIIRCRGMVSRFRFVVRWLWRVISRFRGMISRFRFVISMLHTKYVLQGSSICWLRVA